MAYAYYFAAEGVLSEVRGKFAPEIKKPAVDRRNSRDAGHM